MDGAGNSLTPREWFFTAVALLVVVGLIWTTVTGDDDGEAANRSTAASDESDDLSPAEMLAQLDDSRSAAAYDRQLTRLAVACRMTQIEVSDLSVHAANNVAPDNGVKISISEMLDAIETNADGPVSCDEVAAATITMMMGG